MAADAEYRVRTPPTYMIVVGLLFALATIAGAGAIWLLARHLPERRYDVIALCILIVALPFIYWTSTAAYRIGGGRNLVRGYADRIEVPGARVRQPLAMPRHGLAIVLRPVRVRFRFGGQLDRGTLIELRAPGVSRALSTLVLDDPNDAPALLADLQRFAAGEPTQGRAGHDAPKPRTEYDDRIDRELAQLE